MSDRETPIPRSSEAGRFAKIEALHRGARPGVRRQRSTGDPVEDCAFFCSNPEEPLSIASTRPERLIQSSSMLWAFVRNVFPITSGHQLVIPYDDSGLDGVFPHVPQQLSRDAMEDLALMARRSSGGLYYNSMSAGATVPHFHFHEVDLRLPCEEVAARQLSVAGWHDLAVLDPWPCAAFVFGLDEIDSAWRVIERFQQADVPINLLSSQGRFILVPRSELGRGDFVADFGPGTPGALELCGGLFVFSDSAQFERADEQTIHRLIARAGMPVETALEILAP